MKVIALGDTHGRAFWKDICDNTDADKIVFIGDYVDTHERIPPDTQEENLKEILQYKRENKDRVVLLLGNHDYHYLPRTNATYSGYQGHMQPRFGALFESALKDGMIQACFVQDGVIYTHAGITRTWAENNHVNYRDYLAKEVDQYINNYLLYNTSKFGFQLGPNEARDLCDPYGDNVWQSPTWVRPESLLMDKIHGFKQVVGHTTKKQIQIYNDIAFIDTLGTSGEYLEIHNGEFKTLTPS